MSQDLMPLLDELRIISQNGLRYADNHHDERRYRRILELVEEYYGKTLTLPPKEVHDQLAEEIGHVTPKVGVGAAIFDEEGKILLMKRSEDGEWNVPGGFVDPNEGPRQALIRETREETSLVIEIVELVSDLHQPATAHHVNEVIGLGYWCERVGGELEGSEESTALQYWNIEDVPHWHRNSKHLASQARNVWARNRSSDN